MHDEYEYDEDDNEPVYSITDLDGFCSTLRTQVAASFSDSDEENLDDYITLNQVKNMVKSNSLGTNEKDEYLLNGTIFDETFDEMRIWIYNAGLAKLAARDLVEVYLDTETDEFVFTIKNTIVSPVNPKISDGQSNNQ